VLARPNRLTRGAEYKAVVRNVTGETFPMDPVFQIWGAMATWQDAKGTSVSVPLNAIAGGRTVPVLLHAGIDRTK